jgi:hypothetical protein
MSSGSTGSSVFDFNGDGSAEVVYRDACWLRVFDFNGDGSAEVVYRDACWLRVYDGKTGKVRFAQYITSGTGLELPVIADVDNDNHSISPKAVITMTAAVGERFMTSSRSASPPSWASLNRSGQADGASPENEAGTR